MSKKSNKSQIALAKKHFKRCKDNTYLEQIKRGNWSYPLFRPIKTYLTKSK